MVDDLATKGIEFTTAKQIFGQDLKGLMAMVGGKSTVADEYRELTGGAKKLTATEITETGTRVQKIVVDNASSIAPALTARTGKSTQEVESLIQAGTAKLKTQPKVEKEVHKITAQLTNADKPEEAALIYAAIGNYNGKGEKLLPLLNKVKTETDMKSLYNITNNKNMTFIVGKTTDKELSIVMNRMRKNNGEPIFDEFVPGRVKHFIEGDRNGNYASGFHHQGLSEKGNAVAPGAVNKQGIRESGVMIDGIKKSIYYGKSTLFPEDWGIIKTLDAVSEAYHDPGRTLKPGNIYAGKSGEIEIGFYLDQNGKIKSAFPIL